jgi:hypothetical protein
MWPAFVVTMKRLSTRIMRDGQGGPGFFHSKGERTRATESLNRIAALRLPYSATSNSVQ